MLLDKKKQTRFYVPVSCSAQYSYFSAKSVYRSISFEFKIHVDISKHLVILCLKQWINKQTLDNIEQISSSKDYRLTND